MKKLHFWFQPAPGLRSFLLVTLAGLTLALPAQEVRRIIDVAPVWAGHPVGFHSLVASNRQFIAFYDADRQMTVAARELSATNWSFVRLPEKVGWDSHNYVTMALDATGHLHVSGNLHNDPLVYFRTEKPLDITTLQRLPGMTGRDEQRTTYPRFFEGPRGELIFTYRIGGSGNGDQIYNVYDVATRQWRRLLDQPLVSGEGRKSAYLNGPTRGPDGFFHLAWIWRETPDCATSHYICYARSRDLVKWETSRGQPLALPMTFATCEVVDPVPIHGGAINNNVVLGFDAQKRPIVSYHKFDTNGFTQVYNARREADGWKLYQATDWRYRWEFGGGGTIGFEIRVGGVTLTPEGQLQQHLSNQHHGSGTWRLDEATLQLRERVSVPARYPASLRKVTAEVPDLRVHLRPVAGTEEQATILWLRWETRGVNRDRPHAGPPPPPSRLQVYEITAARPPDSSEDVRPADDLREGLPDR